MKRDHGAIKAELDALTTAGVIRPMDVVQRAQNPESALHDCFTWDDEDAGHQYRLLQARNLLRVYVITEATDVSPIRAFVSLTTDRHQAGGGYRALADVMNDDALRQQMLRDALAHLRSAQKQYKGLQQLDKVWEAVDEAEQQEGLRAAA